MRSYPRSLHHHVYHHIRHHIQGSSCPSEARKLQSPPVVGPDRPRPSTMTKPGYSNPSFLREGHTLDGNMEVEQRSPARDVLGLQPGRSRRRLYNLGGISTPNSNQRTQENEDQLTTHRYAFALSFVGHLIEAYTTY